MKTLYKAAVLIAILFSANAVFAQEEEAGASELQRGITLYRQGAYDEAIRVLEGLSKIKNVKDEATVLNYLGLAYLEKNEPKDARRALEKGVRIAPQNAALRLNLAFVYLRTGKAEDALREAERAVELDKKSYMALFVRGSAQLRLRNHDEALADANRAIALKTDFASAYALKADALAAAFGERINDGGNAKENAQLLSRAVEALEECSKKCAADKSADDRRARIDALRAFYTYFSREKPAGNAAPDETITPIAIKVKPRVRYTDEARRNGITGTVVLAVLFDASGTVSQVLVVKGLGYGLDEESVKAARGIEFTPLVKNGVPVSVVKTVEYTFSIGGR